MQTYIWACLGSAFLAELITPLVILLARRIGAVDKPGIRSVHTLPIPRIGGVAIYLAAMSLIVGLLFLDNDIRNRFRDAQLQVITLLCSVTAVFLIGLVDDLRGLPARFKFIVELLGAGALCLAGVRVDNIGIGDGIGVMRLGWLGYPATLLWIVGITNAVNMSDGLDGLAAGVSAIACGVIALFALYGSTLHSGLAQGNDVLMALFALALFGSLCGFLFFNFNPAKVFMGDCGSLFIGFTIAAASVMCVSKSTALVGLALPALALGIPIFDTLFSMLRRFLERRSLFSPDRSHFHHRLLALGLRQRHAVILIYAATLLAAGLGLLMIVREDIGSLIIFGGVLVLLVGLFRFAGVFHFHETLARLRQKYRRSSEEHRELRHFEDLELRFRQVQDKDQWRAAVREAANQMDFAWVSLKTTYADGRTEEELWRTPRNLPDLSKIATVTIPLGPNGSGTSRQIEIAIRVNGSIEAAGYRASLFGRLMDEFGGAMTTIRSQAAGRG
jgi:UDP-GlcNAc:undecaprenyl-phosphate GlcNAc-1-phosphate transferase